MQLSLIAVGNSLQNYVTLHYTRRLYNGLFVPNAALPPATAAYNPEDATNKLAPAPAADAGKEGRAQDQVTPLAARLFGTYTLISAIVRIYASYHLDLAPIYNIAMWTYIVAAVHFGTECFIYKTAPMNKPVLLPFFFASTGIAWMASQYSFYVKA